MDGNIEFLGRVDQQVKLRGFRIELGEIETVIAGNVNIKECVVTLKEGKNGEKRIVAYIIPAQNQAITSIDLKDFLRKSLPDYMIPSSFVFIETFPISPSGKVDRNALPEPEFDRAIWHQITFLQEMNKRPDYVKSVLNYYIYKMLE